MASFVSAASSSCTAAPLLRTFHSAYATAVRPPLAAPLRAAAQGSANSSPVVMMDSKVKKRNKKRSGAGVLPAAIDLEIREAEEYLATDIQVEIPDDFPFKISGNNSRTDITLTRSLKGEQIEVLVSMPRLDQDEDDDEDAWTSDSWTSDESSSSSSSSDENLEDPESSSSSSSSSDEDQEDDGVLEITVSKGDGSNLEFTCPAYPDEIIIDALYMTPATAEEHEDDMVAYERPDFNELDENLQNAFYKYLELRGITPMNIKFLHEYMTLLADELWDFIRKD